MVIRQKIVTPVLMWLIVAAGVSVSFWWLPARFIFPRNVVTSFLILPAIAYWLYFFIGALRVHRRAPLSAEKIDRIIKEGVYAKVRHPIYSADIILAWSLFFYYPDVRLLVGVHWLMFTLLFWMRLEEKALTEKFGNEYLEYMKQVPKIFPKFN